MKGLKRMRITISQDDSIMISSGIKTGLESHKKDIVKIFGEDGLEALERLYSEIHKGWATPISKLKRNAIQKANEIRVKKAKKKIEMAVNLLRLENKKITVYSVSKEAKVSFNTAKKYKSFIEGN